MDSEQKTACQIEWIEIPAPDLKKASEFYSICFNWEIREYSPEYLLFKSGNLSGRLNGKRTPSEKGLIFSITVSDIYETLRKIESAGGSVIKEKYEI